MLKEKETYRNEVAVVTMGEERMRNDQTAEERPDESRGSRSKVEIRTPI